MPREETSEKKVVWIYVRGIRWESEERHADDVRPHLLKRDRDVALQQASLRYEFRRYLHRLYGGDELATSVVLQVHISHVILRELLKLKTDVTEIKARIQALQESERRPPAQNSCLPPAETPAFPLRNKDDVAALESRIVEGGYRQTLVEWLSKIGGNTTREAAVRVLRATLTDELASQYSWFGAKGKVQFGTLQLASVLYDAVTATGAITKKDFQVTTMGWMKHARQRVEQKQKKAGTAMEGSRAPSPLEGDR
ncbi:uncharacterized protein ISCGN_003353 [Ixodes scapularis]